MCFIIRSVGDQITPQNIRENWEIWDFIRKEAVNDFGNGLPMNQIRKQ